MTPDLLASFLEKFLAESSLGVVLEEGQIVFDLASAHYSISSEQGRCLLHFWSQERNIVRQVLNAELKHGTLHLAVRKFAQMRPNKLLICRDRDQRTPTARKNARTQYLKLLERLLEREFPGWTIGKLSSSMDLKRSLSPVYTRGLLRKGNSSMAVLGVNREETQASVDAILTFGLIWLDDCRQREAGRSVVEGLHLFVPDGRSATLQLRMAHLNREMAKFHLTEVEEQDRTLTGKECRLVAPADSYLAPRADTAAIAEQFSSAVSKIRALIPAAEIAVRSPLEISFRLHGLDFASLRFVSEEGSFKSSPALFFGTSGAETQLTDENQAQFASLVHRISTARNAAGDRNDPFWRMYPERWLESLVMANIPVLDPSLVPAPVYSQVPAFSVADRSLIDVLACTAKGRLAVVELKADEDIHLPVQGIDYWARVAWHHQREEFQQHGYFPKMRLSKQAPLLLMVAPALRIHPAAETVIRYFSPTIEWQLIGMDERWREELRVIFRKTPVSSGHFQSFQATAAE
ncbi:MAG TPA: hypothetical protein VKZ53_20290 [Candidatus Angelobacter sp.]|nr:hypothetical protein [Candidatus Angelobacter sp.]